MTTTNEITIEEAVAEEAAIINMVRPVYNEGDVAQVFYTKDLEQFKNDINNRPFKPNPGLEDSLKKHGAIPSLPIITLRNGDGQLHLIDGHHRLHYAKENGTGIWFMVIDDSDNAITMYLIESTKKTWSPGDYFGSLANRNVENYKAIMAYSIYTGIAPETSACLLAGLLPGTVTPAIRIAMKNGSFKMAENNMSDLIAVNVQALVEKGLKWAKRSVFVNALTLVLSIKELDRTAFFARLEEPHAHLHSQGKLINAIGELEAMYNRGRKDSTRMDFKKKIRALKAEAKKAMALAGMTAPKSIN